MDMLVYRLNMCIDSNDYKQRIEVLKEIIKIANLEIDLYKLMQEEQDSLNNK